MPSLFVCTSYQQTLLFLSIRVSSGDRTANLLLTRTEIQLTIRQLKPQRGGPAACCHRLCKRLFVFCLITCFIFASVPQTRAPTPSVPLFAVNVAVVAGGHPLSVEAGLRILQRGGNAVDAGVATILAASVIEFSHFSFGGEVPILIKLKDQKVVVIEGMGRRDESHASSSLTAQTQKRFVFRSDHDAHRPKRWLDPVHWTIIGNRSSDPRRLRHRAR